MAIPFRIRLHDVKQMDSFRLLANRPVAMVRRLRNHSLAFLQTIIYIQWMLLRPIALVRSNRPDWIGWKKDDLLKNQLWNRFFATKSNLPNGLGSFVSKMLVQMFELDSLSSRWMVPENENLDLFNTLKSDRKTPIFYSPCQKEFENLRILLREGKWLNRISAEQSPDVYCCVDPKHHSTEILRPLWLYIQE